MCHINLFAAAEITLPILDEQQKTAYLTASDMHASKLTSKMFGSSACLKTHCEKNLSSTISAIDTGHHNFHSFTHTR